MVLRIHSFRAFLSRQDSRKYTKGVIQDNTNTGSFIPHQTFHFHAGARVSVEEATRIRECANLRDVLETSSDIYSNSVLCAGLVKTDCNVKPWIAAATVVDYVTSIGTLFI